MPTTSNVLLPEMPFDSVTHTGGRSLTPAAVKNFAKAAAEGDLAAIQRLTLRHPALALDWEPLTDAAWHGHAPIVRFLLDSGADANIFSGNAQRYRPLHRVIEHKKTTSKQPEHIEVVHALLEGGADVAARATWCDVTAAALAAMGPEKQFLPLLLPYLSQWDLFHAAVLGEVRHVATILKRDPAAATSRDENGFTALHYAAASRMDQHDPAAGSRLQRVAEMLLGAGAMIDAKVATTQYVPMQHGPLTPINFAAGNASVLQFLLLRGADPADALLPALADCDYEIAEALVRAGADLKTARVGVWVSDLARFGHYPQAKWMVERGADANGRTSDGRTALHWAAQRGASIEFVRFLLDAGAQANLHDAHGATALDLARIKNRTRTVALLEHHGAKE